MCHVKSLPKTYPIFACQTASQVCQSINVCTVNAPYACQSCFKNFEDTVRFTALGFIKDMGITKSYEMQYKCYIEFRWFSVSGHIKLSEEHKFRISLQLFK